MTKRGFHQEADKRQIPTEHMHNNIINSNVIVETLNRQQMHNAIVRKVFRESMIERYHCTIHVASWVLSEFVLT